MDSLLRLLATSGAILHSSLIATTPLLFVALGATVAQRAGVINIGLEGFILCGAFAGVVGSSLTGSPAIGILAGAGSGACLSMLFAFLCVRLRADQIVVGVGINLFALGLTGVLYRGLFGVTGQAFIVPTFSPCLLPGLRDIPFFGHVFFRHTVLVYVALLLVPLFNFLLFYTRGGLQLRAVGEHPQAAETLGISVARTQVKALLVEGVLGGVAGGYLSLAYSNTFVEGMSAGRGFVALAVVIFGRWHPFGVFIASLFFGGATALQFHLQAVGVLLPYQLVLMLPYCLTLIALAFMGKRINAPASLGQIYSRE